MAENTLTVTELADLRTSLDDWAPDTLSIYRKPTLSNDDYGGRGNTSAYNLVVSGVRCSLDPNPRAEQERAILGLLADNTGFFVTLPANTNVAVDDRLTITSRSNMSLRVIAAFLPESWEFERRVLATKLES
jgi:hypothetical protein